MATHTGLQLLSNRAQENLKTENDFQKFVDVNPQFLTDNTLMEN